MSAPSVSPTVRQAQDYLAAVEHELADLPVDDRSALLEDLALHLEALAAEADDRPIAVRLGPAAAYAADLRAAAGLPPRGGSETEPAGLRERVQRVLALPAARETRRLLGELRPAWWVLRGYLLVLVPCVAQVDGDRDFPVPTPFGNPVLGLLLVLAAVVGSVALGRRTLPRVLAGLVVVGGVALLLSSLAIWDAASDDGLTRAAGYPPAVAPAGHALGEYPLISRHGPVTDVFPYAADGTPLEGVLLYDQDGRPLQVGLQEWWADLCVRTLEQPLAADGIAVPHSFPQNYELVGLDVDIHSNPVSVGQCETDLPRPDVPLPVFPPADPAPASED